MDEILFGNIIRTYSLVACTLCILVSIDLFCGARILLGAKKILDKRFNADRVIIYIGKSLRSFFDKVVNFDDLVESNPKGRKEWGFVFLVLAVLMVIAIAFSR